MPVQAPSSRGALTAVTWLALGTAVVIFVQSDRRIGEAHAALRAFDQQAREAADALSDFRAAQEAYLAEGQGVAFWRPKAAASNEQAGRLLTSLQESATSTAARTALSEASTASAELLGVDKRARDYLRAGQTLLASDVVFSEGSQAVLTAARQIEGARVAERDALEGLETTWRLRRTFGMVTAALFSALAVLLLTPVGGRAHRLAPNAGTPVGPSPAAEPETPPAGAADTAAGAEHKREPEPTMRAIGDAARLCTALGRVRDVGELQAWLALAATAMGASGIIVWRGDADGGDLHPALAHGYPAPLLVRMSSVPRTADNATAAAYRTGEFQVVRAASPSGSSSALVAPVLSAAGCIGVLSAELMGADGVSDDVRALAEVVAAQLVCVLPPASSEAGRKVAGRAS